MVVENVEVPVTERVPLVAIDVVAMRLPVMRRPCAVVDARDVEVVDVREPNEFQINRIPGSQLIPLGEIPRRYAELDPEAEIVVHCKMGGRSAKAADYLRSVGFKRVLNLKGGILDWVDKVDPSQPKY